MKVIYFCLFLALAAVFLVRIVLLSPKDQPYRDGQKITLLTRIESSPKVKGTLQTFRVHPRRYEPITVTAPSYQRLYYGQKVKLSGTLKRRMLEDKRVVNSIYFPIITLHQEQGLLFVLRQRVTQVFEGILPPDHARLLLGVSFGMKEPFSPAFSEAVKQVGLLHVIAASGMNITLLVGALVAILGRLFSRKTTIISTLLCIICYAAYAGFEPSIVRASIMGSLALFAGLMGRQYFGLWALFLTAYVMIMLDVRILHDVGFHLSFLATLGIIIIKPLLSLSILKPLGVIGDDLTTSMSAQVTTVPLLLGTFGEFNLLSLLANAAILWTVPPLMILGGIGAIASFIFEPLAVFVLFVTYPLLSVFILSVEMFSLVTWRIEVSKLPVWIGILYYIVICILIVLLRRLNIGDKHE